MVNCSYCHKEVKRLVFCSPSHKVLYHRKFTKGKLDSLPSLPIVKDVPEVKKEYIDKVTTPTPWWSSGGNLQKISNIPRPKKNTRTSCSHFITIGGACKGCGGLAK